MFLRLFLGVMHGNIAILSTSKSAQARGSGTCKVGNGNGNAFRISNFAFRISVSEYKGDVGCWMLDVGVLMLLGDRDRDPGRVGICVLRAIHYLAKRAG